MPRMWALGLRSSHQGRGIRAHHHFLLCQFYRLEVGLRHPAMALQRIGPVDGLIERQKSLHESGAVWIRLIEARELIHVFHLRRGIALSNEGDRRPVCLAQHRARVGVPGFKSPNPCLPKTDAARSRVVLRQYCLVNLLHRHGQVSVRLRIHSRYRSGRPKDRQADDILRQAGPIQFRLRKNRRRWFRGSDGIRAATASHQHQHQRNRTQTNGAPARNPGLG